MMEHRVVSDGGLQVTPNGCAIDIRLPWYRSLPLSVVEVGDVEIDGTLIDRSRIRFELNGESLRLDELLPRTDDWWYVLDSAMLRIDGYAVARNEPHVVSVTVSIRPPYIHGWTRITKTTKTITVQ
jgi:hypothetical protein